MQISNEHIKPQLHKYIFKGFIGKAIAISCAVFTILPFFIPDSTPQQIKIFILISSALVITLIVTILKNLIALLTDLNNTKEELVSAKKELNSIEIKLSDAENKLEEITNNRDTILDNYKQYKNKFIPYENICNEISVAVDAVVDENPRNKAICRLKIHIDKIKVKYLPEGDNLNDR